MNLISCDSCAVVLDRNKMAFEGVKTHDEEGQAIDENTVWVDGPGFVPVLPCPNCSQKIDDQGNAYYF